MRNKKRKLERKIMGPVYYVPFIVILLEIVFCIISMNSNNKEFVILLSFENIIPLFASWWSIYSLYELLEENGGDVILTYSISKFKLGIVNNLVYLFRYILIWIVLMLILMKYILGYINQYILLLVIFQSLFYSAFSFFVMAVLKDTGWSFFIQIAYFCLAYFTNGNAVGVFNIYIFQPEMINFYIALSKSIKCVILSIILFTVGHTLLDKKIEVKLLQ